MHKWAVALSDIGCFDVAHESDLSCIKGEAQEVAL